MKNVKKRLNNSLVVDSDGELLIWTQGKISGSHSSVKTIKQWCRLGREVNITPFTDSVPCVWDDEDDIFGALAALFSLSPGKTRVLFAPQFVLDYLDVAYSEHENDMRRVS